MKYNTYVTLQGGIFTCTLRHLHYVGYVFCELAYKMGFAEVIFAIFGSVYMLRDKPLIFNE